MTAWTVIKRRRKSRSWKINFCEYYADLKAQYGLRLYRIAVSESGSRVAFMSLGTATQWILASFAPGQKRNNRPKIRALVDVDKKLLTYYYSTIFDKIQICFNIFGPKYVDNFKRKCFNLNILRRFNVSLFYFILQVH